MTSNPNNTARFKERQIHCCLDIETYGTTPNAAIASIGAIDFKVSENFEPISTFYRNIDQDRNKELGREFSPKCLDWWQSQPLPTQKSLMTNQRPLDEVIKDLIDYIHPKSIIWVQGMDFDIPIIRSSMQQLGYEDFPIKYYNIRDSRTIFKTLGYEVFDYREERNQHNALGDASDQAKLLNHLLYQIEKASS